MLSFCATRYVALRPALIGISSRVIVPSLFGVQPGSAASSPASLAASGDAPSPPVASAVAPPSPAPSPATQVPSGAHWPDAQSAPTRQARAASSPQADAPIAARRE